MKRISIGKEPVARMLWKMLEAEENWKVRDKYKQDGDREDGLQMVGRGTRLEVKGMMVGEEMADKLPYFKKYNALVESQRACHAED